MFQLQNVFMNILSMSTIASIVFILVLFARKFLKSKISFSKINLLWIIFILVLIFPIKFSSKLSIKNYIPNPEKVIVDISKSYDLNQVNSELTKNISNEKKIDYIQIISVSWLLVAIILIAKDIISYNTFLHNNKIQSVPENITEKLQKSMKRLNIQKDVKLVIQGKIKTPSLHGILDPKILLTNDILELSDDEIECILLHELNHYKQHHNVYYLLLRFIERIYWFNPIVYIAGKIIRQDLEFITDNLVINEGIKLKDYCKTIVKVASLSNLSIYALPSICNDKEDLERRIKQMKNKVVDTKYAFVCIVVVLVMISLVTISLASNKVENSSISRDNVEYTATSLTYTEKEENVETSSNEMEVILENKEIITTELVVPLKDARISAKFGKRIHPITNEEIFHSGVDVAADEGEEVLAVADGKVIEVGFNSNQGNYVTIKHQDGTTSLYAHGSKILASLNQEVTAGEIIMLVGSTGMATGPHLHFEMQNEVGEYIDVNQLFE